MRSRYFPVIFALILGMLIAFSIVYMRNRDNGPEAFVPPPATTTPVPVTTAVAPPSPGMSPSPGVSPSPMASGAPTPGASSSASPPDLTTEANGLSQATVVINTSRGAIKFKFYPKDAPNSVARVIALIKSGFYNGLTFNRVVPGFIIQGGDPTGTGKGGSGQALKAEFNDHRHVEGTVAMARGADPDSADSQFYISLGTFPKLDRSYTVIGQVIEGIGVAKQIQQGDSMVSVTLQ